MKPEKPPLKKQDPEKSGRGVLRGVDKVEAPNVRILSTGEIYVGEILDSNDEVVVPHGCGLCIGMHGEMYEGEWQHGRWHGNGTLTDAADRIVYEGQFHDGSRDGLGKYYFENAPFLMK